MQIHRPYPVSPGASSGISPELSDAISRNPTFQSLSAQVAQDREAQAMRYAYVYTLSGSIAGQTTSPFLLTIEQGADFKCLFMTGNMYCYDAVHAGTFPIPNALGVTAWSGDGLSVMITDTRSGRTLTSGFTPMKLLFTPGYGLTFQNPLPWKYTFLKNSRIQFDVRNRDVATRTHTFDIALIGYKVLSTESN